MDVGELLGHLVERQGSDLHLKAGSVPYVRVDGELVGTSFPLLTEADTERIAVGLMDGRQAARFTESNEADFACTLPGLGRFRVNAFRQRGAVGLVCRRVLPRSPGFEALGLPSVVARMAEEPRGLILVTGPTGSGKSTTTAAVIDHINAVRRCHVVTIEDPIEVLHTDNLAVIDQREVGVDTADFATALKYVARQDPDVIFIGEMRDEETTKAALQAAETGHLVISTLHTADAAETVNRVLEFFPPHQQRQIRLALAGTLRCVVSQRLLPRVDGRGRVAAVEIMVATGRVFDFIVNPEHTHLLPEVVAEGEFYGMQTFDQALLALYRDGLIGLDAATLAASNPHDFRISVQQAGLPL
ncbi:MAG TPA: PilT/PilU family type 4a pilus ATPase [Actinomycetota bacterium]|nr:PilT/PilU family type 4a pilus ATPase [Actinomycetota bacterium]